MNIHFTNKNLLGINGLGRMGKLTLWEQIRIRYFDGFVINIGREVGTDIEAVAHTIERDSTYGSIRHFLFGYSKKNLKLSIVDKENGLFEIDGISIKILMESRNPEKINWGKYGVRLVIDCTGAFKDPTVNSDKSKGCIRGHLASGAEKVIISAPYKIKDPIAQLPNDSAMFIYGINHLDFDPLKHHIISAASCTTTALSHMMKPLLDDNVTNKILTASMSTIHAATNTQSILDSIPEAKDSDLRKNRSIFNNIILTSTGAAKALELVLPEIQRVGFMADSVRIPTNTASLIVLNITFHSPIFKNGEPVINKDYINNIYKAVSQGPQKDLLIYSIQQNVSADIIGYQAAVVIEGHENHTRTGFVDISGKMLKKAGVSDAHDIRMPVTHAKIFGWYDNEYGSYIYTMSKLAVYIDKNM